MNSGGPFSQSRRDQARADISRHITDPQDLRHALKQFNSLTEYAPGEEQVCTWEAALDNCEQVKGYFPATTPEPVLENIEAIAEEIRLQRRRETPTLWRALTSPRFMAVVLAILVLLWVVAQCAPRR